MTEFHPVEACARPKPTVVRWRHPFGGPPITQIVCSECDWTLGLLEYEQGGRRLRWWRHVDPPVAIG